MQWVPNGLQAVEAFKVDRFDVVLMDLMMPIMDGLEASRQIREYEGVAQLPIPIIALTASVLEKDRKNCELSGINSMEMKPIDFDRLFKKMEQLVSQGRGTPNNLLSFRYSDESEFDFSSLAKVINFQQALKRWQDESAYLKALKDFARERPQLLTRTRLLFDCGDDYEQVRKEIHSLKGVAANLGCESIAQLANRIETRLYLKDIEAASESFDEIEELMMDVTFAIGKLNISIDRKKRYRNCN